MRVVAPAGTARLREHRRTPPPGDDPRAVTRSRRRHALVGALIYAVEVKGESDARGESDPFLSLPPAANPKAVLVPTATPRQKNGSAILEVLRVLSYLVMMLRIGTSMREVTVKRFSDGRS